MSKTVRIYKIDITQGYYIGETGRTCSLYPWGNTRTYKGYDDGGKDYYLPDGFELADNRFGGKTFFGPDEKVYELSLNHRLDQPQLFRGDEFILLNEAKEE